MGIRIDSVMLALLTLRGRDVLRSDTIEMLLDTTQPFIDYFLAGLWDADGMVSYCCETRRVYVNLRQAEVNLPLLRLIHGALVKKGFHAQIPI